MIRALIPWYLREARHPLKDKVVGRYWRWFSRDPVWIDYDDGLRLRVDLNDYLQQKVFYEGYYERVLVEWLKATLRPEDVFWDVGANVGVMTLVAARRCARVVAFEPEPSARRRLEENIAVNAISNVTVLPFALGARDAAGRMRRGPPVNLGMTRMVAEGEPEAFEVAIRAAGALIAEGTPAPHVMKVDVEGAELDVFRGAGAALANPRLRAVVFEAAQAADGSPADATLVQLLRHAGLQIRELGRSDPEVLDAHSNFLAERP
jgi:FkbM family methyltransferase